MVSLPFQAFEPKAELTAWPQGQAAAPKKTDDYVSYDLGVSR